MNPEVIAEIIASSFDSDRPVSRRYSACVILHALNKYPTSKTIGYGDSADGARINAIRAALQSWGCMDTAAEEVRVSSRTLPNNYGRAYLDEAYMCAECASRMPAGSQAYKDMMGAAEWYEQQYIAVRYDYLRNY